MRLAGLAILAACSSSPSTTMAPRARTTPETAIPVATAETTATPVPTKPYELPASAAASLASEQVTGSVLVSLDWPLAPTATAARATARATTGGALTRMMVVADQGDVVKVATMVNATPEDCVAGYRSDYRLEVYVPRAALVPRAAKEIVKVYGDGSAYAIDRGAPVAITPSGLAWRDGSLAQSEAKPRADELRYSVDYARAKLPPVKGDPLVCENGTRRTLAEYRTEREQNRQAELAVRREKERAAAEKRCAEEDAKKKAQKKKKKKKPTSDAEKLAVLLGSEPSCMERAMSLDSRVWMTDGLLEQSYYPWCGILGSDYDRKLPEPRLGEVPVDVVTDHDDRIAILADGSYVGDVSRQCGMLRVVVHRSAVGHGGAGVGGIGGSARGQPPKLREYHVKPGKVVWPGGTPAGTLARARVYKEGEIAARDALYCVPVANVNELVCHHRSDVDVH